MLAGAWDERLRPLVVKHGAAEVWRAGLGLFGHPPTWEISTLQREALSKVLETES